MELHEIDNELSELEALKGDLPQQVNRLRKELQDTTVNLANLKKAWEELKRSKLHWEGEIKVQEDKLKKYQDQLFAVKTNKEYDAITLEIDSTNEKIDEAETKVLEFIESEEQFTKDVINLESQIGILEEELQNKERELEKKIKASENESNLLETKRQELISHIRKPILYQYQRIRKVKGYTAIVSINKYTCGGCFATIPPQKVLEIRTMEQLIFCESCGRILVYKNDQVGVSS